MHWFCVFTGAAAVNLLFLGLSFTEAFIHGVPSICLPSTHSSAVKTFHEGRIASCLTLSGTSTSSAASVAANTTTQPHSADKLKAELLRLYEDPTFDILDPTAIKKRNEKTNSIVTLLEQLNPTADAARQPKLNVGNWRVVDSSFNKITKDGNYNYCTLGRLCFNVFEPVSLEVKFASNSIMNKVALGDGGSSSKGGDEENQWGGKHDYDIITSFSTCDGSVNAVLENNGKCWPDEKLSKRLIVKFTGGRLTPAPGQDMSIWTEIFSPRERKKPSKLPNPLRFVSKKMVNIMLKLFMGFKRSSEMGNKGELTYAMERAPEGWLDILYLDEDMRITRGNSGTIFIVTKSPTAVLSPV